MCPCPDDSDHEDDGGPFQGRRALVMTWGTMAMPDIGIVIRDAGLHASGVRPVVLHILQTTGSETSFDDGGRYRPDLSFADQGSG